MTSYRKYYVLISLSIIILVGLIVWGFKFYESQEELIALIDVTLTTIALTIAILEIVSVKKITDQIEQSVVDTKKQFESILSLSDVSRSSKTIEEIQSYLGNKKIEMAYLRLKDLRKVIVESQIRTVFALLNDQEEINICCAKVYSDIEDLNSTIYYQANIDTNAVSKNLEKLSLIFTQLEEIIKKRNL